MYNYYIHFFDKRNIPSGINERVDEYKSNVNIALKMIALSKICNDEAGYDEFTYILYNLIISAYRHHNERNYEELAPVLFDIMDAINEMKSMEFDDQE